MPKINTKTDAEIDKLRVANKIVGKTLEYAKTITKEGVSLLEIDKKIEEFVRDNGARPSFKGLYSFPNASCLSLNNVIIHGIPNNYILKEGDTLGIDVGTEVDGYYGDAAITLGIGKIDDKHEEIIKCAKDSLYHAISNIEVGLYFKDLSKIIEEFIKSRGFIPLEGYCGHGIGTKPHEAPEIPNYVVSSVANGPKINNGMVFCLEPMICQKEGKSKVLLDGWSVVSTDSLVGSHYEHTVAVYNNKVEILSEV